MSPINESWMENVHLDARPKGWQISSTKNSPCALQRKLDPRVWQTEMMVQIGTLRSLQMMGPL